MTNIGSKITISLVLETVITRQALLERHDLIPHRRLTVLCAPAGYGKTILISQWIGANSRKVRAAWVWLSERDNTPEGFWNYAIQALDPFVKTGLLDRLDFPDCLSEDSLDQLIARLATEITGDVILVLDDIQIVTSEPIHRQLAYLVEYLPEPSHQS